MDIKRWANPLTVLSFSLAGINSLLLLFHINTGFNMVSHLYLGCTLLAGIMIHGLMHLSDFRSYSRRSSLIVIAVYLLSFGLSAVGIVTATDPLV